MQVDYMLEVGDPEGGCLAMEFKMIGFVGVGSMGKGMVSNLLKKGYSVTIYDVDKMKVDQLCQIGAKSATNIAELAKVSDAVVLSLPSVTAVEETAEGLITNARAGIYILDASTIDPVTTKRIAAKAMEKGIKFLDCPVSGGPTGAKNGTLTSMVGAPTADDFEVAKDLLSAFANNIICVGEVGAGQTVKIVNNILAAIHTVALGEALIAGTKAGVELGVLADAISKSSGKSFIIEYFAPNSILRGNYDNPLFMLKLMNKDVSLYKKMADDLGIPSFLSSIAKAFYTAAVNKGWGDKDHTVICRVLEELSSWNIVGKDS
jgi:3-hydroxyisobutyrate dehydrogenase-like beta-hydroxyacid dehydrogenase